MKKKKIKEGYSLEEVRILTDKYIDEMAERLRKRLRAARKTRVAERRHIRHGVAACDAGIFVHAAVHAALHARSRLHLRACPTA